MNGLTSWAGLDDWHVVCQFLPPGWEEAARTLGALRRARGIPNANILIRVLLVHLVDGCSLQETALRAEQAGWCSLSAVAIFKRLRASEQWLQWMAQQLRRSFSTPAVRTTLRVRLVDATTVQEYGNTGTDWRIHFAIDLHTLHCDHFELTDVRGGETYRRIPVQKGDVLLGDRVYGTPALTAGGTSTLGPTSRTMSDDGRFTVFTSTATNLIAGQIDRNNDTDIFLFDRVLNSVSLVSHAVGQPTQAGEFVSSSPLLSSDGRYVSYESYSKDLLAGYVDGNGPSNADVFLYDRINDSTTIVSRSRSDANRSGNSFSYPGDMSGDGRYVTFFSQSGDMIAGQPTTTYAEYNLFLFDRIASSVTLVTHQPRAIAS